MANDDDDNVFGKDFGDNPGAEEVDGPVEQLLPVSTFEKMIDNMNLDLHVRTEAVRFASSVAQSANVQELLANAKKIEEYLIHGSD